MTPTRDPADLRREAARRQAELLAERRRTRWRVALAILGAGAVLALLCAAGWCVAQLLRGPP